MKARARIGEGASGSCGGGRWRVGCESGRRERGRGVRWASLFVRVVIVVETLRVACTGVMLLTTLRLMGRDARLRVKGMRKLVRVVDCMVEMRRCMDEDEDEDATTTSGEG